ncbi:hypothetical protein LZC95_50615 [Pendulispora brunnea]|uniref:Uncharacterized protein n=1 Tax=Pendulispora brunnea TaxID=2905690 RepID=A0ABZ2KAR5_9BACT
MNNTIARLISTVLVPASLVAGAIGCHHEAKSRDAVVAMMPAIDRDAPIVPKNHRDLAFYSARVQGESQTKIFVRGPGAEAPRVVYVDIAPGELISVSNDGTEGVFRRFLAPGLTEEVAIDFRSSES